MKPIIKAAAVSLALAAGAAPALAQPLPPRAVAAGGWDLDRRIDWLEQRIDRGRADGSLDRREARRVEREVRNIRHEEHRMMARHHGRLWDRDRDRLEARLDRLADRIHWLRHNDERRPW